MKLISVDGNNARRVERARMHFDPNPVEKKLHEILRSRRAYLKVLWGIELYGLCRRFSCEGNPFVSYPTEIFDFVGRSSHQ